MKGEDSVVQIGIPYYLPANMTTEAVLHISSAETISDLNTTVNVTQQTITAASGQSRMNASILLSLHGVIFLLAIVGNGLVIATLALNRRMRTITNIFLLNLAISDLLLATVCMPFTIIPMMMEDFIFGAAMCVIIRYLQGVTVSASVFTLVAISLERFYAICKPLKSRKWQNLGHSYKIICIIWLTAMVINIPMAVFQEIRVINKKHGSRQCIDNWPDTTVKMVYYVGHLFVADLVVPLTIMSIAYGLIARSLWNGFKSMNVVDSSGIAVKAKRQMSIASDVSDISDEAEVPLNGKLSQTNGQANTPTTPSLAIEKFTFTSNGNGHNMSKHEPLTSMRSHSSKRNIRSKKRVIKMLFVIVIEFFVCWTPLYLVYIWIVIDAKSARANIKTPAVTISLLRLLAYVSSCCNPITYCFMSKKFRAAFLTAFRCRKEVPLLRRKATQSTQISYCDTSQLNGQRSKLSSQMSNGNGLPKLAIVPETSTDLKTSFWE